jgi:hypothetical protein
VGGYLTLYNFFDLFFENFKYNLSDLKQINLFQTLAKILNDKELFFEDESIDIDRIKSIELFIEQENSTLNKDKISKKFIDLVKVLNKKIFEIEKENLDKEFKNNPNDPSVMQKYNELIKAGKEKGIR